MYNIMLTVGNVIIDESNNKKYRVVAIVKDEITLCEMNVSNFSLTLIDKPTLFSLISSGEFSVQEQRCIIIDKTKLSEDIRKDFEIKKQMMLEVIKAYEPSFIELNGRK